MGDTVAIGGSALTLDGDHLRSTDDLVAAGEVVALLLGIGSPPRDVEVRRAEPSWSARPRAEWSTQPIDVDQTNRSVVVDGPQPPVVVKLVSSWGSADRAARLLDRLARVGSRDVPALLGHLEWDHRDRGAATVAIATQYVLGSTDGWIWAVDDVLDALCPPAGDLAMPSWPRDVGALAARLHHDLASGGATAGTVETAPWQRDMHATLDAAVASTRGAAGGRLRNRAATLRGVIDDMPATTASPRFEGHGDLHVGQVLRDPVGTYVCIDFDGDPQLSDTVRGRPEPAARDLAHLLVSVDQVASVVQRQFGRRDDRVTEWSRRARADLLDAYRAELAANDAAHLLDEGLLPAFEVEQLARELIYAAHYLPRWVYAGDGALESRFPAQPDWEEMPWTPPAFSPTSS